MLSTQASMQRIAVVFVEAVEVAVADAAPAAPLESSTFGIAWTSCEKQVSDSTASRLQSMIEVNVLISQAVL